MKKKIEFRELDYSSITNLRTIGTINKTVKFSGYIGEIEEAVFIKDDDKDNFTLTSNVTFVDEKGRTMGSLPIKKSRYHALEKRFFSGEPTEVIGVIRKVEKPPKKKGQPSTYKNMVDILKTRSGDRPSRILQATESEKEIVEKFKTEINHDIHSKNHWALFNALKETIIEEFNIAGVDKNARYSDTLDAMISQAFSGGKIGNTNGKIHVGVIGPPASGKKLFFEAAKLLNIVYAEAQSGTLSPVGLAGSCLQKKGVWHVERGLIPKAHGGVLGLQDYDKSQMKPSILEILGPVMEDGKCIISKAGKATFIAETAIYMDLNRTSDLILNQSQGRNIVEDTGLQTYIISRLDYICELPKNTKRQFQTAIESIRKGTGPNPNRNDRIFKFCQGNGISHTRFLELLTALIVEQFERIDTSAVLPLIENKLKALIDANRQNLDQLENLAMFQMRFKNSIFKFVVVLTRLQLLKKSNQKAVDKAFHILSRKLQFLKNIDPDLLVPRYRQTKDEQMAKWLFNIFGNKTFTIEKAFRKYEKTGYPIGKVKLRQFRNRIEKICAKKEHNKWGLKAMYKKK